MGFRDLHLFNLAMLGKQGWRILTRPDSLCARTLKGKYYHNSSFLSAKRKCNSSHTWQAILKGRQALKKGFIKLIGDGTSTQVWTDQWISRRQHIRYKPTNLCKLENYQSEPLDVDPMDGVRRLKRKKRPAGGGLKRKKIPPLTLSIGSASSDPNW